MERRMDVQFILDDMHVLCIYIASYMLIRGKNLWLNCWIKQIAKENSGKDTQIISTLASFSGLYSNPDP